MSQPQIKAFDCATGPDLGTTAACTECVKDQANSGKAAQIRANDGREKRKRRFEEVAFAAFLVSVSAALWFCVALLGDFMNPRLLFIPFLSFLPPISVSLLAYLFCKYAEKRAESIVTGREEAEEQRRRELVAAVTRATRPAGTENTSDASPAA